MKVVVGMSGGVDSTVSAYLLKSQGYEVIGITLLLQDDERTRRHIEDAAVACESMGIEHVVLDKRQEFKGEVMDYFAGEYLKCRTPNPCIQCNKSIKWKSLTQAARDLGADNVATGHYAGIRSVNGRFTIYAQDHSKDQSYFLYMLSQEELSKTLFPLEDHSKEKVRSIAKTAGFHVAAKTDSQDVCFIPDGDFVSFIDGHCSDLERDRVPLLPGEFVDVKGNVLGSHRGLYRYTVGQRKKLGISLGKRIFVQKLDEAKNRVVLCDDEDLYTDSLMAGNINMMAEESFVSGKEYTAKTRYSQTRTPCRVHPVPGGIRVEFSEPVRAVTPGQAVVIYDGNYLVGGGVIRGQ